MTPEYLKELFAYNQWANARVLKDCENLTPEQWLQPQGHSWGSIRNVVVHNMAAERIWFDRIQGTSRRGLLNPDDFPDLPVIHKYWNALTAEIFSFLDAQTKQSVQQVIEYQNTSGKPFSLEMWKILVHVANHATHHRGELAAMFAVIGVDHVEEDWYYYFLELK
jgi:uncharacterized damage-inducible protein DinB